MPRNKLTDLNNHLFEALERLNDDEILENEENFDKEIKRSKQIVSVGRTIIANANLILDAEKYFAEYGYTDNSGKTAKRLMLGAGEENG